jgi:tyrosine-protein kinase Etk/Wzc
MSKSYPNSDSAHPLDFLILLVHHWRTIIYTSAVTMVLVYLILFLLPNTYRASARFLPPQQNLTLSAQLLENLGGSAIPGKSTGTGLGGMASSFLGLKAPGDLYVSIMAGNTISDRIIKRFDLQKIFKVKYLEDARTGLRQTAQVSSSREGIITVEVIDKDPQRAAAVANAYIDELETLLREMAVTEAQSRLAFLEKEYNQANLNLAKAEEILRTFAEKNSVVQIDVQTRGALEYIANLRAAVDSKEVQIKVLRQQATPGNYDLIRLETEVKGLREKLQAAETQYDPNCIGDVCLNTSKVPALGLEYLRLYRDVKFREGLYQLYTKMVEIARLDLAKDVATIQVIDTARPPTKRDNKRLMPTLLAGMATFLLMVLVVLGREQWSQMQQDERMARRLSSLADALQPWTDRLKSLTGTKKIYR